LLSFHSRVYGNWPGFGYVTAVLLAASFWAFPGKKTKEKVEGKQPIGKLWKWSLGTSLVLTLIILFHAAFFILPVPYKLDRAADEIVGWDQLGARVGTVAANMPRPGKTFIFGLRYQVASELAFYAPGQPRTVSINRWNRPNVYDYWWQDRDLLGFDAVGVLDQPQNRQKLESIFEKVGEPEPLYIYRPTIWHDSQSSRIPFKTFYICRCYGFKGGLRWSPPDKNDIRAVE